MGYRERAKMKVKQRLKRRKKRRKLVEKGKNPDEYYSGRFYIGNKDAE